MRRKRVPPSFPPGSLTGQERQLCTAGAEVKHKRRSRRSTQCSRELDRHKHGPIPPGMPRGRWSCSCEGRSCVLVPRGSHGCCVPRVSVAVLPLHGAQPLPATVRLGERSPPSAGAVTPSEAFLVNHHPPGTGAVPGPSRGSQQSAPNTHPQGASDARPRGCHSHQCCPSDGVQAARGSSCCGASI